MSFQRPLSYLRTGLRHYEFSFWCESQVLGERYLSIGSRANFGNIIVVEIPAEFPRVKEKYKTPQISKFLPRPQPQPHLKTMYLNPLNLRRHNDRRQC